MISGFEIAVDGIIREFSSVFLKNFCIQVKYGVRPALSFLFSTIVHIQWTILSTDLKCPSFLSINPSVVYPYHILAFPFFSLILM